MSTPSVVLAVAGTDSGGAAGLAADLATIGHLGAHAACVVTAVTAQDTTAVHRVHALPADVVDAQIEAVLGDLPVAAVKTGMLGSAEVVALVAERLAHLPLVVDPVLVATSGAVLGDESVTGAYRTHLLPVATVVTPNLDEARALTGLDAPPAQLATRLADLGCAVVITGGVDGEADDAACTDWLALPGEPATGLTHPAVPTRNDHGTGCTYSAALATHLAQTRGQDPASGGVATCGSVPADWVMSACLRAAAYTAGQLAASSRWTLGRGRGPVAHLPPPTRREIATGRPPSIPFPGKPVPQMKEDA